MKQAMFDRAKKNLKTLLPEPLFIALRTFYHNCLEQLEHFLRRHTSISETFTRMYRNNYWGSSETYSGSGSEVAATNVIRQELPQLLKRLNIRTMLDAPCGDFNWMQHLDLGEIDYLGVDVVQDLIALTASRFSRPNRRFQSMNIVEDPLAAVDLILCRDCLIHLCDEQVLAVLQNFKKSGSRYLFTTTFPRTTVNVNIITGHFRPINLQLPPFNMPEPLSCVLENAEAPSTACDAGKSMALWDLKSV